MVLFFYHITSSVYASVFRFASPPPAPSFGALANQNPPSFGNLAQQGPGFGSQPSSFSGFGQQPQAGGETTILVHFFLFLFYVSMRATALARGQIVCPSDCRYLMNVISQKHLEGISLHLAQTFTWTQE